MSEIKLVLLRHGESTWNQQNRFTGWTDVPLTPKGEVQARNAGKALAEAGFTFDLCYTSVLRRAIKTLWLALEEMDEMWLPVVKDWRLNERHYGALQGLDKHEMAAKVGKEQVFGWRRSYTIRPPELAVTDERFPSKDPRYRALEPWQIPTGEGLGDTVKRVLPFWEETIAPSIRQGRRVLISAHGNSLRGLVKYLDQVSDDAISQVEIPTGEPLVYCLDEKLRPNRHYYLNEGE